MEKLRFGGKIMASEAQINANRANAQKSTGPRTAAGKAVASRNAITHGFLAQETVIAGEDAEEFALYRDRMLGDLAPVGGAEQDAAERIVGLAWRLRRAERLQTEAFDALYERMTLRSAGGGTPAEGVPEAPADAPGGVGSGADRLLGRMVVEDFSNGRVLERLLVYERRIENSLYRTMRELREQKQVRVAGGPAETMSRVSERALGGTGLSPAQPSLCKTNPMYAGSSETTVSGGKEGGNDPRENGLCETNPISRGDPSSLPVVRRVA